MSAYRNRGMTIVNQINPRKIILSNAIAICVSQYCLTAWTATFQICITLARGYVLLVWQTN